MPESASHQIKFITNIVKYFRISPATRFLMLQLGYTENDLPKDKMVVNKYALQEAIKKGLKKALGAEPAKEIKKSNFFFWFEIIKNIIIIKNNIFRFCSDSKHRYRC